MLGKMLFGCFFGILLLPLNLWAAIEDCDSLVTTDGKVYMVHSAYISKGKLLFINCYDPNLREISLPLEMVERVGKERNIRERFVPTIDPLMAQEKSVRKLTGIGMIMLITAVLTPIGFLLLVVGAAKSERILRQLKLQPDHPKAKYLRKVAKNSIFLCWLLVFILVFLYLVVVL